MKVPNGPSSRHHSTFLPSLTTGFSLALIVVIISTILVVVSSSDNNNKNNKNKNDDEDGYFTCDASLNPQLHPQDESLLVYVYDSIASTQDEAKRIAQDSDWNSTPNHTNIPVVRSFVVTTREQTTGRGTNGRLWLGQRGNVFVTIGIRQADWMSTKIALTLLPLKIGSLVAYHVQRLLDKDCVDTTTTKTQDTPLVVTVKWPNDVLVNERKISGVLIESSSNGWFLIGIGINLAHAPQVEQSGPNRGRQATSLADLCPQWQPTVGEREAQQLAIDLAYDLHTFVHPLTADEDDYSRLRHASAATSEDVLQEWKQWIDWDMELIMRDTPDQERVKLVGVMPDGRVEVQNVQTGRIRTIVSDYFL